jgi:hypothetical protein
MAGPAAVSAVSALGSILGSLSPQQLGVLGRHLTSSQEMQALQILATMNANPAIAAALLPSLSTIPNLPPQVMTWVTAAITEPPAFQSNMAQAMAALQNAATSPGLLGGLGL